jgi:hypothetical protein
MTAPYTFVGFRTPMPGHHFAQETSVVDDRPVPGRLSGRIDCTITALSPLFVGSADHTSGETMALRSDASQGSIPVIPGSALKGMVRSYLAAMTGSTIGPQSKRIIWYRNPVGVRGSLTMTALHKQYLEKRGESAQQGKQRIGLLTRAEGRYSVAECTQLPLFGDNSATRAVPKVTWRVLKSDLTDIARDIDDRVLQERNDRRIHVVWALVETTSAKNKRSVRKVVFSAGLTADEACASAIRRRDGQRADLTVPATCRNSEFIGFLEESGRQSTARGGGKPAAAQMILHATGLTSSEDSDRNAANDDSRSAYLFPIPGSKTAGWILRSGRPMRRTDSFEVAAKTVELALSEAGEQSTEYQRALPDVEVLLQGDGVPVFFDTRSENGREVVARLGRGGGFRLQSGKSLFDTIDPVARDAVFDPEFPDLVQSLFGDSGETTSRKGRVAFGTAWAQPHARRLSTQSEIVLLGPKIEAWYRRLKQLANPDTGRPVTYASDDPSYRGREFYLHRWPKDVTDVEETWTAIAEKRRNPGNADNGVGRAITPVAPETTFTAGIRFTNLTAAELGALLVVLLLGNTPEDNTAGNPMYAHLVGGGRPLGLGSVHLSPTVYLDHPDRYTRWDAPMWHTVTNAEIGEYMKAFRVALEQAEPDRGQWTTVPDGRSWPRSIAEVFTVAQWRNRLPEDLTAEMPLADHRLKKIPKPLSELTPMFER